MAWRTWEGSSQARKPKTAAAVLELDQLPKDGETASHSALGSPATAASSRALSAARGPWLPAPDHPNAGLRLTRHRGQLAGSPRSPYRLPAAIFNLHLGGGQRPMATGSSPPARPYRLTAETSNND